MTDNFLIKGKHPLNGEVEISGYKNSAGVILAAVLLSPEPAVISNLPRTNDVLGQLEIIKNLGATVEWESPNTIKIDPANINPENIPIELFEKMRVSVFLISPLLTRFKNIKIPHPGGDKIGLRPIHTHIEALKEFNIETIEDNGFYHFKAPSTLTGKRIVLKEFSVSATEIIMMLAAKAQGTTIIELAAAEPQVQDLAMFLNKMGAKVSGAGTHTITIEGTPELKGATFTICPDPLEAGTLMIAFALTQGQGKLKNINPNHLTFFLEKMKDIGINFTYTENELTIYPTKEFKPTKIQVLPYPGFPTDLQPQTSVLLTQAQGRSLVHDPLYENRFQHLHELRKMGADIEITDPHRALIFGKKALIGNKINASDIRSGAALILAGLCAEGETLIKNVSQIERGYERLDEKLRKLGADIKRV